MVKRKITHRIVQGDSLSDRGTLDKRNILGFIPMNYLSGLSSKSPRGRFTNGFLWGDFVATTGIEKLEIKRLRRRLKIDNTARGNADIADEFINNSRNLRTRNEDAFSLNEDGQVLYEGHRYARFYCEGGLTAHDFSKEFTFNPLLEFTRLSVSTLEQKRQQLLDDDIKYNVTEREKQETLITEWSGANDLITVNGEPTRENADKAIAARMLNLEKLLESGYRNFVMMNMPDLSLAPRFQQMDSKAQANAKDCSDYFNTQLAQQCALMQKKYQGAFIDVFDVCGLLRQVHDTPSKYGFDQDKLTTPFVDTDAFKQWKNDQVDQTKHISPSKGYMFWDDVHPTADMHAWLALEFEKKYDSEFEYEAPITRVRNERVREIDIPGHERLREYKDFKDVKERYDLIVPKKQPEPLPQAVLTIMDTIRKNSKIMMASSSPVRQEKGKLLKDLLIDIEYAHSNLWEIRRILARFQDEPKSMGIVAIHENPIFDMLFFKHTTRSQDDIKALQEAVIRNIQQRDTGNENESKNNCFPC